MTMYLLVYPNGTIHQTHYVTKKDTEEARIFCDSRCGMVEAVSFYELEGVDGSRHPYVAIDGVEDVERLNRLPVQFLETRQIAYKRKEPVRIMPPMKRDKLECWLDRHNHKLEFLRTLSGLLAAIMGVFVFLRVFGLL